MRMSNLDILSRDFWKDNRRFADLFNTVLYDGKQVILPEKLMEADSNLSGSIQTKKKEDVFVERRADLIRKFAEDSEYAIFLLENQSHIHYGMPLRVMMYDALGYREECAKKKRENKGNAVYANRDEFLSGMRKEENPSCIYSGGILWRKTMGWTKKTEGYDGGYAKMDGEKLQRLFYEPAGNTVK